MLYLEWQNVRPWRSQALSHIIPQHNYITTTPRTSTTTKIRSRRTLQCELAQRCRWITLYQFIFTTDEKPTIVYPVLDEIPTTPAFSCVNWCKNDVFTSNIMGLHHKMSQTINNNKNTKWLKNFVCYMLHYSTVWTKIKLK